MFGGFFPLLHRICLYGLKKKTYILKYVRGPFSQSSLRKKQGTKSKNNAISNKTYIIKSTTTYFHPDRKDYVLYIFPKDVVTYRSRVVLPALVILFLLFSVILFYRLYYVCVRFLFPYVSFFFILKMRYLRTKLRKIERPNL